MSDLLEYLGTTPLRRRCFRETDLINLKTLTHRPEDLTTKSSTFKHWVSLVMGQAIHFVIGTYIQQGVSPRDRWAFWAPIKVNGQEGDAIFTARSATDGSHVWYYGLYFYSKDERLHRRLATCVLSARVAEGARGRRIVALPVSDEEDGLPMTWFELTVETDQPYALSLLEASQID